MSGKDKIEDVRSKYVLGTETCVVGHKIFFLMCVQ